MPIDRDRSFPDKGEPVEREGERERETRRARAKARKNVTRNNIRIIKLDLMTSFALPALSVSFFQIRFRPAVCRRRRCGVCSRLQLHAMTHANCIHDNTAAPAGHLWCRLVWRGERSGVWPRRKQLVLVVTQKATPALT